MELVTITYRWNDCPGELCEATAALAEKAFGFITDCAEAEEAEAA